MRVKISGVGLFAPGLPNWDHGRAILRGEAAYQDGVTPPLDIGLLPPNERRRATNAVRLSLHVAQEAISATPVDPAKLYSVFSCSGGDTETLDKICTALTLPERPVSPNQFHNSVHNAPAGYWAIATGSMSPSTSLSAYDASFAAGLLDAISLVQVEAQPVLLVAYDVPPPRPLFPFRPLTAPFSAALLLCPESTDAEGPVFSVTITAHREEARMEQEALEVLRNGNPAARCLPMLSVIATGEEKEVVLPYFGDSQLAFRLWQCG